MIFIGTKSRNKVLGQREFTCLRCKKSGYHTIVRSQGWFTLYFIPVIPLGKTTTSRCSLCGFRDLINNTQANSWFLQDQVGNIVIPEKTSEQLMEEGYSHYQAGRFMEAMAAYDQVLQQDHNRAGAYYGKGNALSGIGRYEEAIVAYDRAIKLAPSIPDGYVAKGKALESLGRTIEGQ